MEVTIATWNCYQGTDKKLPAFMEAFSPDSFAGFFETLLDRHGLVSAYHQHTGHGFGDEPDPTLFWLHKREAPYHCDVILVPESWASKDVHVGDSDTWCAAHAPVRSDHVPVVARVGLPEGSSEGL